MNSLPARVANIYPNRSFAESERLMCGKYVNNILLFRRNDVTEAARLYRDMNDYAKYIEHGPVLERLHQLCLVVGLVVVGLAADLAAGLAV